MGRRRKTNIMYQMEQAINEINRIGQSKRELRSRGEHGLHSYNQIEETLSVSANFVKWAKEQGVKNLYHLKEEHYRSYIEFKRYDGVTNGHLINIETGLRHLQKGMAAISVKLGKESVNWTSEKRLIKSTQRETPSDRSYTRGEIQALQLCMSREISMAAELSVQLGLRAREVIQLTKEHINLERGVVHFSDTNSKGVTKGGRPRVVPVPEELVPMLEKLGQGKEMNERLLKISSTSTLRSGLSRAAKRSKIPSAGWHGFRHTFARKKMNELLEAAGMAEEGKQMMSRIFENIDKGRKANYGIRSRQDQKSFSRLKSMMDTVHRDLGHGEGRWDLARVYMRTE